MRFERPYVCPIDSKIIVFWLLTWNLYCCSFPSKNSNTILQLGGGLGVGAFQYTRDKPTRQEHEFGRREERFFRLENDLLNLTEHPQWQARAPAPELAQHTTRSVGASPPVTGEGDLGGTGSGKESGSGDEPASCALLAAKPRKHRHSSMELAT